MEKFRNRDVSKPKCHTLLGSLGVSNHELYLCHFNHEYLSQELPSILFLRRMSMSFFPLPSLLPSIKPLPISRDVCLSSGQIFCQYSNHWHFLGYRNVCLSDFVHLNVIKKHLFTTNHKADVCIYCKKYLKKIKK